MIYFDNSATTQLAPEVKETLIAYMNKTYGNPSSPYQEGRTARKELLKARAQVARTINAVPGDIDNQGELFFTGSGTEADNLAIMGSILAMDGSKRHLVTSVIEHPAVLNTFQYLERQGYDVEYLPVDSKGSISLDQFKAAVNNSTALVSIMYANNEVGTIQNIKEMAAYAHTVGAIFHTDAVQALGKIRIDVKELDVDLLTISGHKIYGPKGIGAMYVKQGIPMHPYIQGGHQEYGLRPGTENMLGIVGFSRACQLILEDFENENLEKQRLANLLEKGLKESIPDIYFNGNEACKIPGHVNVTFKFVEGESLLMSLNLKGIACSSGSACTTGSSEPSHVLTAMGLPPIEAQSSIRFTVGRYNTEEEVHYLVKEIPIIVERLRKMSPLARRSGV
ncbi:cysteine desulfurase [Clostridia bacterium]|nr:cysteine desulfurase [Clostridia bacterium]